MVRRARKAAPAADAPPPARGAARPALAVVATLALAAAALYGVSRLGDEARRNIGPRDRYALHFADIRCAAPPGSTREAFLAEVRYNANAAPTFQALDPELKPILTAAFAAHPWVWGVESVSVEPPGVVSVKLTFRVPVLAVAAGGAPRAVDAKGILLPATAPTAGLPELLAPVAPPARAGEPWPDAAVVRAASVAAEYRPKTIERTPQGWQLIQPDGRRLLVGR